MDTPPQTFKTRKAAFDWLIDPEGGAVTVSSGKFYKDADRLKMVQPDKSVQLSDLLAYVKRELKVNPMSGQGIGEVDRAERMAKREEEEQELKLKKLRREEAKAEGRLIDIDHAEAVTRRKILTIYGKVVNQFRRDQERILYALGIPPSKASTFMVEVMGCVDGAFNEMRSRKTFSAMIRGGEDSDAE